MARRVLGAAVVPSAARLLPPDPDDGEPPPALTDLRARARQVLVELPDTDTVVLVATGPRGFHDRAHARVDGHHEAVLTVARDLLPTATRLTQYPQFAGDPLGPTLSVLGLLVREVRGDVPVLPTTVPAGTDPQVLQHVGASLVEVIRERGGTATVVVAGDLSTGDGGWDRAVVEAVRGGDTAALGRLGPDAAAAAGATGWAPVVLLQGVAAAARLRPVAVHYDTVDGAGRLLARYEPAGAIDPGDRYRRPQGR